MCSLDGDSFLCVQEMGYSYRKVCSTKTFKGGVALRRGSAECQRSTFAVHKHSTTPNYEQGLSLTCVLEFQTWYKDFNWIIRSIRQEF